MKVIGLPSVGRGSSCGGPRIRFLWSPVSRVADHGPLFPVRRESDYYAGLAQSARMASMTQDERIRLDKWLWAARFYKTRALARQAIEGGKVRCEGIRTKPGKIVEVGMTIRLQQGDWERIVIVQGVRNDRRPAPEAQLLYRETEESIRLRDELAAERKARPSHWPAPSRPTKKQRRNIRKFREK